jgi:hypothetical protein
MKLIYLLLFASTAYSVESEPVLSINVNNGKTTYTIGRYVGAVELQAIIEYKRLKVNNRQLNNVLIIVDSDAAKLGGVKIWALAMEQHGKFGPFYVTSFKGVDGYSISTDEETDIIDNQIVKEMMRRNGIPCSVIMETDHNHK